MAESFSPGWQRLRIEGIDFNRFLFNVLIRSALLMIALQFVRWQFVVELILLDFVYLIGYTISAVFIARAPTTIRFGVQPWGVGVFVDWEWKYDPLKTAAICLGFAAYGVAILALGLFQYYNPESQLILYQLVLYSVIFFELIPVLHPGKDFLVVVASAFGLDRRWFFSIALWIVVISAASYDVALYTILHFLITFLVLRWIVRLVFFAPPRRAVSQDPTFPRVFEEIGALPVVQEKSAQILPLTHSCSLMFATRKWRYLVRALVELGVVLYVIGAEGFVYLIPQVWKEHLTIWTPPKWMATGLFLYYIYMLVWTYFQIKAIFEQIGYMQIFRGILIEGINPFG